MASGDYDLGAEALLVIGIAFVVGFLIGRMLGA